MVEGVLPINELNQDFVPKTMFAKFRWNLFKRSVATTVPHT